MTSVEQEEVNEIDWGDPWLFHTHAMEDNFS